MLTTLRRIGRDIRQLRHIDAYVVSTLAVIFAVLTVIGDTVPDSLKWASLLAGVGILVYRVTIPVSSSTHSDDLLRDRSDFDGNRFAKQLLAAQEVWIFGPSAVNVLSTRNCDLLRRGVLYRPEGIVRVVVLDPFEEAAVALATRHLDDSLDYPVQDFRRSLETTLHQLRAVQNWETSGDFSYRLIDFNPGFSMVAVDPSSRHGRLIVEFHGFHNESTASRLHLELTRDLSVQWYNYWIAQFDWIWHVARNPMDNAKPHSNS